MLLKNEWCKQATIKPKSSSHICTHSYKCCIQIHLTSKRLKNDY